MEILGLTSENFWLNLKNCEEILKKCEDSLRTGKFAKCLENLQKILENFTWNFQKNFEEIRLLKEIGNFNKILKIARDLSLEILVEFVINSSENIRNFCETFKWILWE